VTRATRSLGALAVAALAAAGASACDAAGTSTGRRVPTARVARATLKLDVWTTGQFKATRVVSLAAPSTGGGLRLIRLADTGTAVKAGDVVMEFDPAEQQYALEQAMTELAEAEQTVIISQASIKTQVAGDEVGLLNARYAVRRADLDAKTPEHLLPGNDYKKRQLTLEEVKRRLTQAERDIVSRRVNREAGLSIQEESRNRSKINADRAQSIIDSLVVRAPIDGLVLVRENRDATGGVFFSGMSLPEYRLGDTIPPGRSIVDVSDTANMEITARVNEQERTMLVVGQPAIVRAHALPGQRLAATITALSGVAVRTRDQAGPLRQFEATLRLDRPDTRLRPGTTVRLTIQGKELPNALTVPRQAVFQQDGRSVVYLRRSDGFEPLTVTVVGQSESRTAIEGIEDGAEIALINPIASASSSTAGSKPGPAAAAPSPAPAAAPAGGGRR